MSYREMSDEDILKDLAGHVENLRISRQMKESELESRSGIARKTLYNFRTGATGFSLKNFIRLLRAMGELDRLQLLFPEEEEYSPVVNKNKALGKRVRDKKPRKSDFLWGDEQ